MKKKDGRTDNAPGSTYNKSYDATVYKLALLGLDNAEMGAFFDVAASTIRLWAKTHESFGKQLRKGRLIADAEVAVSLYKRATGYEYKEERVFCSLGVIVTHETTVHVPPDTKAATIWLMNRQRDKWTIEGQERKAARLAEEAKTVEGSAYTVLSENPAEASRQYLDFVKQKVEK